MTAFIRSLKTIAAAIVLLYGLVTLFALVGELILFSKKPIATDNSTDWLSIASLCGLGFALPAAIFQLRGYPDLRRNTWLLHAAVQAVAIFVVCNEYIKLDASTIELLVLGLGVPTLGLMLTIYHAREAA